MSPKHVEPDNQSPPSFPQPPQPPQPPRKRMRRIERANTARYLTFSCSKRLPLLDNPKIRDTFAAVLAESRGRFGFRLLAWVAMPEDWAWSSARGSRGDADALVPIDRVM